MSELPPETPTQSARVLIGWFAGALAFKSVEALYDSLYAAFFAYGLGAVVVAVIDYNLKNLMSKSPRLTRSLNNLAADARLWVVIALSVLLIPTFSPFIEQRRWPFGSNNSSLPHTSISSMQVTPSLKRETIAEPPKNELIEMTSERDKLKSQLGSLQYALAAAKLSYTCTTLGINQVLESAQNSRSHLKVEDERPYIEANARALATHIFQRGLVYWPPDIPACKFVFNGGARDSTFYQSFGKIAGGQQCLIPELPPVPLVPPSDADGPFKKIDTKVISSFITIRYPKASDVKSFVEADDPALPNSARRPGKYDAEVATINDQAADGLMHALQHCGLDARRSYKFEAFDGHVPDKWTIYIDLGNVRP